MELFVFLSKDQRKKNKSPGAASSGKAPETSTPAQAFNCWIAT